MNRSHSWTDYQERLSRVVAYIHDHLDEPLDLTRLAEVAHLSAFHWHRVYQALHGETIAATVRRLRLHRATGYLANTALPIEQIARKCGYPNVQSFTRAFGGLFGTSPTRSATVSTAGSTHFGRRPVRRAAPPRALFHYARGLPMALWPVVGAVRPRGGELARF